jgi:hypothetical protein
MERTENKTMQRTENKAIRGTEHKRLQRTENKTTVIINESEQKLKMGLSL